MCTIIEQGDLLRLAVRGYLRNGFGEKEETLAHNNQLRRNLIDQLNRFLRIHMIMVFRQWQMMEVNSIFPSHFERLPPILNAASKDTNRSMTDVSTSIGRVGNNGITTAQIGQGQRSIRRIAADRTYIGLFRMK